MRRASLGIPGAVRLEDAGLRLGDLAERPEARRPRRRERAAAPPGHQSRLDVGRGEELRDEAALADPGHADDRDELRPRFARRPLERADEQAELVRAADERSRGRVSTVARARTRAPPSTGSGCALPFATTGSAAR